MWRLALGGALLILFATVVIFSLVGAVLGANMSEAVFVGACVSLSSTAVVVKCVKSTELEQMYGLLVMQDVLLGVMLVGLFMEKGFHISLTKYRNFLITPL